jgi:hypothetical protein
VTHSHPVGTKGCRASVWSLPSATEYCILRDSCMEPTPCVAHGPVGRPPFSGPHHSSSFGDSISGTDRNALRACGKSGERRKRLKCAFSLCLNRTFCEASEMAFYEPPTKVGPRGKAQCIQKVRSMCWSRGLSAGFGRDFCPPDRGSGFRHSCKIEKM